MIDKMAPEIRKIANIELCQQGSEGDLAKFPKLLKGPDR